MVRLDHRLNSNFVAFERAGTIFFPVLLSPYRQSSSYYPATICLQIKALNTGLKKISSHTCLMYSSIPNGDILQR